MTTVRELIHQLTADYINLDDRVQVYDHIGDLTGNFKVTSVQYKPGATIVRIEAA